MVAVRVKNYLLNSVSYPFALILAVTTALIV